MSVICCIVYSYTANNQEKERLKAQIVGRNQELCPLHVLSSPSSIHPGRLRDRGRPRKPGSLNFRDRKLFSLINYSCVVYTYEIFTPVRKSLNFFPVTDVPTKAHRM